MRFLKEEERKIKSIAILSIFIFIFAVLTTLQVKAQDEVDVPPVQTDPNHVADERSSGGLFVEPFLTYERGEGDLDYPAPLGSTDTETEGFGLGARLGFHLGEIFFLGGDARYSFPDYKSANASDDSKVDAEGYNLGLTAGVQTPLAGVRVWATYILDGGLDPETFSNGVDVKFKDMEGYRLGVGLFVQSVSINLEYQKTKYDSMDVESIGSYTGPEDVTSVDMDDKTYILSVSFPIAL